MRKRKKCVSLQPLSRETASEDEILWTAGAARSILSCKRTRERETATAVRTENFFKKNFEKSLADWKILLIFANAFPMKRKHRRREFFERLYIDKQNVVRGVAHYNTYNEWNETRNRLLTYFYRINWRSASWKQKTIFKRYSTKKSLILAQDER